MLPSRIQQQLLWELLDRLLLPPSVSQMPFPEATTFIHLHVGTCYQQLYSKCLSVGVQEELNQHIQPLIATLFSCGTKAQARWNGFLRLDLRVYVMDDTSIKQACTYREDWIQLQETHVSPHYSQQISMMKSSSHNETNGKVFSLFFSESSTRS